MSDAQESSAAESSPAERWAVTSEIRRPLVLLAICTLGGAILGCLAGGLIGEYAPSYYRMVFDAWDNEKFAPTQTGMALGFLQGGGAGIAIGVGLVVLSSWWRATVREPTEDWPWPTETIGSRWVPVLLIGLLAGGLGGVGGFVAGAITGQQALYQSRAERETSVIEDLIGDDPRYAQLELTQSSDGYITIHGTIADPEAQQLLQQGLERAFGVLRAGDMVGFVNQPGIRY